MPNSRQTSVIDSPSSNLTTNRMRSSITEHSFHGIDTSRSKAESVTYVSGTPCYLCLGPLTFPNSSRHLPARPRRTHDPTVRRHARGLRNYRPRQAGLAQWREYFMVRICVLATVVFYVLRTTSLAWSQPATGSMDVHWDEGAVDCAASPIAPIQVHRYEPQTFVLRVNPCRHFEANFVYLLVGSKRALLIDTGPVADPTEVPIARTVIGLLPGEDSSKFPLLVVHTHEHRDHRAGDPQF